MNSLLGLGFAKGPGSTGGGLVLHSLFGSLNTSFVVGVYQTKLGDNSLFLLFFLTVFYRLWNSLKEDMIKFRLG